MKKPKKIHYELEYFYPDVDRQKFWNMFVDHEAWSKSEFLPGEITIINPGKDHPQGLGAVRILTTGSIKIKEEIVGFRPPEYFRYATYNGSLPVNDLGGELFFEEQKDGLFAKYKGGFSPKYFGSGWLFKYFLRSAQKSAFRNLGKAYEAYYKHVV